jgi:hypothetical protein
MAINQARHDFDAGTQNRIGFDHHLLKFGANFSATHRRIDTRTTGCIGHPSMVGRPAPSRSTSVPLYGVSCLDESLWLNHARNATRHMAQCHYECLRILPAREGEVKH